MSEEVSITLNFTSSAYLSKSFFRFPHIALEYTSFPIHVRCNPIEPTSRFQGFETNTAALKRQSAPSSAKYYRTINETPIEYLKRVNTYVG